MKNIFTFISTFLIIKNLNKKGIEDARSTEHCSVKKKIMFRVKVQCD